MHTKTKPTRIQKKKKKYKSKNNEKKKKKIKNCKSRISLECNHLEIDHF